MKSVFCSLFFFLIYLLFSFLLYSFGGKYGLQWAQKKKKVPFKWEGKTEAQKKKKHAILKKVEVCRCRKTTSHKRGLSPFSLLLFIIITVSAIRKQTRVASTELLPLFPRVSFFIFFFFVFVCVLRSFFFFSLALYFFMVIVPSSSSVH